ncbi:MAG: hypothetical protein CMA37_00015 [Euryarchaeota archaeon]|nr:hypothetical protein [Euryarchaeota archaeon]
MAKTFNVKVPEIAPNRLVKRDMSKSFGEPEKYNILTFAAHERYQSQLAKTGHNFYLFQSDGVKNWNNDYAPLPDNHYILPRETLYKGLSFDMILSHSKFGQFQMSELINKNLGLPIISLEHTVPTPNLKQEWLDEIKNMTGDIDVFISEYSKGVWELNTDEYEIVHHSVDTEIFKPRSIEKKPYVLSVVNDFINRDYCCNYSGWVRITEGLDTRIVGDNGEIGSPADSVDDLVNEYNSAQVFLNTSTFSPIPSVVLEAMACGSAVVSTATCMIPEIIEHGVNGMISNDESELRSYIEQLLSDKDLREKIGKAARETILNKFTEESFLNNWNKIFAKAYEVQK